MSADMLAQAFASSGSVLGGVSADQMERPTPCVSWTVRDLINHLVGGTTYWAETAETGNPPAPEDPPTDFTAADYCAEFARGAARAVAVFSEDTTAERIMHMPYGDLPGSLFLNIAAIDAFTHGWDLARATGQSTDLNPALAEQLLGIGQLFLSDGLRGADGEAPFGLQVEVAASASAADRLAGFMGRQV